MFAQSHNAYPLMQGTEHIVNGMHSNAAFDINNDNPKMARKEQCWLNNSLAPYAGSCHSSVPLDAQACEEYIVVRVSR